LRLRFERLLHRGVTFDDIVDADLQQRRSALDELDPDVFAAEQASVLVLHPDGSVDALAVLAGSHGPTRHPRRLTDDVVTRLAQRRPPRWTTITCLHAADVECGPGSELLAAWRPAVVTDYEGEVVPWSVLLVADSAPTQP
jgi:hypothetical protein